MAAATHQNPSFRPLNQPRELRVTVKNGEPAFVQRGIRVAVDRDHWRIEDRWWTETPIKRDYWELELDGGNVVTLFHDEIAQVWYEQRPGEPVPGPRPDDECLSLGALRRQT